jgi:hypothetical protein
MLEAKQVAMEVLLAYSALSHCYTFHLQTPPLSYQPMGFIRLTFVLQWQCLGSTVLVRIIRRMCVRIRHDDIICFILNTFALLEHSFAVYYPACANHYLNSYSKAKCSSMKANFSLLGYSRLQCI